VTEWATAGRPASLALACSLTCIDHGGHVSAKAVRRSRSRSDRLATTDCLKGRAQALGPRRGAPLPFGTPRLRHHRSARSLSADALLNLLRRIETRAVRLSADDTDAHPVARSPLRREGTPLHCSQRMQTQCR